jgi:hypothetical protein
MATTKHNISAAVRGVKELIKEIKDGDRAFCYIDFMGGMTNEGELIAALRREAEAQGLAFEVEYDDGDLVIWIGQREYFTSVKEDF